MGYILPISHDDYRNYQYRMQKEILGLQNVQQSYKVIQEKYRKEISHRRDSFEFNHIKQYRQVKNNQAIETKIAEITGKGVVFNMKV